MRMDRMSECVCPGGGGAKRLVVPPGFVCVIWV